MIVANTSTAQPFNGWVLVDARINAAAGEFRVAYSNHGSGGSRPLESGHVELYDRGGSHSSGWARRVRLELAPMELQVLTQ